MVARRVREHFPGFLGFVANASSDQNTQIQKQICPEGQSAPLTRLRMSFFSKITFPAPNADQTTLRQSLEKNRPKRYDVGLEIL